MFKSIASALAFLSMMRETEAQFGAAFPAVTPPAGNPVSPGGPTVPVPVTPTEPAMPIPIIPLPQGPGGGPLLELNCGDPCLNTANCPSACAQTIKTIENPPSSFTMECTASGSCAASQFTFAYSGGVTTHLESIKAGAPYALYGSTFTIDNTARGTNLVVRAIECGNGLCAGAIFRFLNADYGDIKCDEYSGCGAGCMVEMPPDAPVPCDMVSTT